MVLSVHDAPRSVERKSPPGIVPALNRIVRFILTLGVVLAALVAGIYGAMWAIAHPPYVVLFIVGIFVLAALGRIFHLYEILKGVFK